MLDVHPPHEPIDTWRGFFIHIATIVIGLLIAISLEQTVEFFHHREQRRQLALDHSEKTEPAVWAAAKASGALSVLSRPEIEAWERVDYLAQHAEQNAEGAEAAQRTLNATCDYIGASLEPGSTVHLTLEQRDELTRSLATLIESGHALIVDRLKNQAGGGRVGAAHDRLLASVPLIPPVRDAAVKQTVAPVTSYLRENSKVSDARV
jgi:hypothetical protein